MSKITDGIIKDIKSIPQHIKGPDGKIDYKKLLIQYVPWETMIRWSYIQKKCKLLVVLFSDLEYTNNNRTQHASQRCGPRWVF